MKAALQGVPTDCNSREHDQIAAAARSMERYRRAGFAAVMSALAKFVSIASVLITIPATLKYLGSDRFSVWMTITSLTALLSFADFGLGNGLMNAIGRAWARGEHREVAAYTRAAIYVLSIIALVGIVFAVCIAPIFPWNRLLAVNPSNVSSRELALTMMTFIICMSVAVPLAIVQKSQFAMQLGNLANTWQLIASLTALGAILFAISFQAPLWLLVFAALATPNIVLFLSALVFWVYQKPQCSPARGRPTRVHFTELTGSGMVFFVIQIAGCIAFTSDTLIVAHLLGPAAVAQYSVVAKLIDGIVMISALALTPLWPAYTDAHARGDWEWIKKTLKISMYGTVLTTAGAALVLVIVSRYLTTTWVGADVPYSLPLFIFGGVWAVVKASGNALSMFLNGLGWINVQAVAAIVLAIVAVAAKISFVHYFGIAGVPLAMILAYLITVVIPYSFHVPKLVTKLRA